MELTSAEALSFMRRASTDIIFPSYWRPVSYVFHVVVWGIRKVVCLTKHIKELIYSATNPGLHGMGRILSVSGFVGNSAWITAAVRIVCIVRPLISLSESGHYVRESAKGVVTSIFRDKNVAMFYQQMRGTINKATTTRIGFFFKDVLPLFIRRLGSALANTTLFTMYSFDFYEALTAKNKELIARSLNEFKAIVDQVGKQKLFRAIDFHKVWLNPLLHKFDQNMNVNQVKDIVSFVMKVESTGRGAIDGAVEIIMQGILNQGGG